MSNKRVQVSDDAGTTWYTLPGNQAERRTELASVDGTIFGQAYESNEVSLGQWQLTANSLFKGVAGYNIKLSKGGTPIAMTAEACTLVSGKTYQITATAKRVISYLNILTVLDNAVDHTSDVLSIDYLAGTITFKSAYTPTGPITVTGSYVPLTVVAKARSFNLTQTQTEIDQTGYDDAQANGGLRVFAGGLKTVNLEVGAIFNATMGWNALMLTRGIVYIECDLDVTNGGKNVFRGFFKIANDSQSGNQGAVEAETVQMQLWVPDGSLVLYPFSWYFGAGTTINAAIQKCINAWVNQSTLKVRYLPSGATGQTPLDGLVGDAIVTEASLANAIDGQNEFSYTFRGTGALTAV